jgi:hypothetical protein
VLHFEIECGFLKLDTQGYDLEVVRGAQNILSGILALQTELSFIQIYENMPNYHTVIEELNQLGFDITFLEPLYRDHLLRVAEFDCVMINRVLAQEVIKR